ncbi:MAG: MFS transporter [Rhabdochlamydiaceae bacterium]|nr:MFS transporter [Rhabdochlamydiaceae bacterium]
MRTNSRLPIYLIYFLDNFGFAIVFPLFSTFILSSESFLLPPKYNMMMRNILYGTLSGAFPLGMFFGAPLLGNASDFWGRKRVFTITLCGICLGNLLTALSLFIGSYYFLLTSRLITGFFSGNLTLCHAALSDLSPTPKIRAKNFGMLTAIGGSSWIIAILLGKWATSAPYSFNPSLPFLISAAVAIFNLMLMSFLYQETSPGHTESFNFKKGFNSALHTLRSSKIRRLVCVLLFFSIGWLITLQWFGGFSIESFHTNHTQLINIFLSIALCWILAASLLNRFIVNRVSLAKIPFYALLLFALLLPFFGITGNYYTFCLLNILSISASALILCNLLNLFSISAPAIAQGRILGLTQAVIAGAQFLAPQFGTFFLLGGQIRFYLYTSFLILLAFIFLWSEMNLLKKQKLP